MVAQNVEAQVVFEEDRVLESSYPIIPIPELKTLSACEFLLDSAKENAELGRTKWLTNTFTGETLNFSEAEPMYMAVGSALQKRGMKKGDVVLYMTSDVTQIFVFTLGVRRNECVMYTSYPEDTLDIILQIIQDANVKWIFCDPISVPLVKKAISQVEWDVEILLFVDEEGCTNVDGVFANEFEERPKEIDGDLEDPLLISLYTSGTTEKSKGAVYTNPKILASTSESSKTSNIPYNYEPSEAAPAG